MSDYDPNDARNALSQQNLLLDLLSYVPGWVVMKRSEVDRLLNEAEALRIERDAARAAALATETAKQSNQEVSPAVPEVLPEETR